MQPNMVMSDSKQLWREIWRIGIFLNLSIFLKEKKTWINLNTRNATYTFYYTVLCSVPMFRSEVKPTSPWFLTDPQHKTTKEGWSDGKYFTVITENDEEEIFAVGITEC